MTEQTVMMAYITVPNRDEALRLAAVLVEERLAACANVNDGMTSLYWWQGQVQQEREVGMIVKTRADLMTSLEQRVRELHSYTVPCVVAWPLMAGYAPFLDWVRQETRVE
jgi:periplasmic divalent cation tolerance protein